MVEDDLEVMRNCVPEQYRKGINKATLEMLKGAFEVPEEMEIFKENFITFSSVLSNGNYTLQQYYEAVKYVGFKMMGLTNLEAYRRTFPERILRLQREGKSEKSISAYVAGYNSNQIVTRMFAQAVIPLHILNQGAVQQAINAQLTILATSKNDLAITKAADSILNHCKPPVESKVAVKIENSDTAMLDALIAAGKQLSKNQRAGIENKTLTVKEVAEDPLFYSRSSDPIDVD